MGTLAPPPFACFLLRPPSLAAGAMEPFATLEAKKDSIRLTTSGSASILLAESCAIARTTMEP